MTPVPGEIYSNNDIDINGCFLQFKGTVKSGAFMSFAVEYDKDTDYILVTVNGSLNPSILPLIAAEVKQLIDDESCFHVLADFREAQLTASITNTYKMPDSALNFGICRSIKRALVVKEIDQNSRFLETVFLNRGNIVKLFDSLNEARSWLNGN